MELGILFDPEGDIVLILPLPKIEAKFGSLAEYIRIIPRAILYARF